MQAVTRVNVEQASESTVADAEPPEIRGRPPLRVERASKETRKSVRVVTTACMERGGPVQHGKPRTAMGSDHQLVAREGQTRPCGVAERAVVPWRPGNAGGGKGPCFGVLLKEKRRGDWR